MCGQLSLYPLHVACNDKDKSLPSHFSCAPVIEMLIKAGIDVNLKDPLGASFYVLLFVFIIFYLVVSNLQHL